MAAVLSVAGLSAGEREKAIEFARGLPQGSPIAVLLEMVVEAAQRGVDVTLLDADKELTPNEAATLLKVSRPHLIKIMDRGLLAYRMVGSNRRIALADLVDYIDRHERANAHVNQLLGTRSHARAAVMDEAAHLDECDLAALAALSQE